MADKGEGSLTEHITSFGFDLHRTRIEPLGYDQIADEDDAGPAAYAVRATNVRLGENPEEHTVTIAPTASGSALYAAVIGGWLPAAWAAFRHRLLLDRNAVSWLRKNYLAGRPREGRPSDLFDMVPRGPFLRINHLLYAMEGNTGTWPSREVVVQQLEEARSHIRGALPDAAVEPSDADGLEAIEGVLGEWASTFAAEDKFLRRAAPLIRDQPGTADSRLAKLRQLLALAVETGAARSRFVVLAAVAALLGPRLKGGNPAFGVLKPGASLYGDPQVWNACCDLRALRLLTSLSNFNPGEPVAFVTGDKRLVRFWAALGIDNVESRGGQLHLPIKPHEAVFGWDVASYALWEEWKDETGG